MQNPILIQLIAISLYAWFMGFTFCDGFKLHIARKLAWWAVFFIVSLLVLKTTGEFNFSLILPVPSILALILCFYEKRKRGE